MGLIRTVIRRPVTIIVIFSLVMGLGIYSCSGISIDLLPNFEPPFLFVFTSYAGVGPEEIEENISRPIENAVSNVSGIAQIQSVSSDGFSQVSVEFEWGVDLADASNDIRDRLEQIKASLPQEATVPRIFKFNPSQIPVMTLNMTGERDLEELYDIGVNIVQPRIERITGVAQADISGGSDAVIEVEVPLNRLEAYGLTLTQIANAIGTQNSRLTVGNIAQQGVDWLIEAGGEFNSISDIENTVIAYRESPNASSVAVLLRDVADVRYVNQESTRLRFIDNNPAIVIDVQKQSDSNLVEVSNEIRAALPRIQDALPMGIDIRIVDDNAVIIRDTINQVSSAALWGALLAIGVILLFLRNGIVTFIIGISIPISVVVTLMLMYFANLTLNIMTLTGLALGIGMLVDNSIVILENIFTYLEKGTRPKTAALFGTREMFMPILASTLTTVCVFAPIIVFQKQLEVYGVFFSELAFTVVISLATSFLSAMLLVPTLSGLLLKTKKFIASTSNNQMKLGDRIFKKVDEIYKTILTFALRRWGITIGIAVLLFVGSLLLIPSIGFLPFGEQDDNTINISLEMPIGTEMEITQAVLRQMEVIAKSEIEGLESTGIEVGGTSDFSTAASHIGRVIIQVLPASEGGADIAGARETMRKYFNDIPGAVFSFGGGDGGNRGGFSGPPIDIIVTSGNYDLALTTAIHMKELLDEVPEVVDAVVDVDVGRPLVSLKLNRDRIYSLGLNINTIGRELRAMVNGIQASTLRANGKENDIIVIGSEESRNRLIDLERLFVQNNRGERIPVANFAALEYGTGALTIQREDQRRTIHVTADYGVDENGRPFVNAQSIVDKVLADNIILTEDLAYSYGGDAAEQQELLGRFIAILLVAVFLVFGVMAAQFESFRDPFIIFMTVPLVLIGVLLIHFITNDVLTFMSIVGITMLTGIIVNNGIVLVDYTNLLYKRGRPLFDACIEAGMNRLRPILMSNITTIFGLLPVALYSGDNATLVSPIAKSVAGGLIVSSLMTLFLVPTLYWLVVRRAERVKQKRGERRARRAEKREERLQQKQQYLSMPAHGAE